MATRDKVDIVVIVLFAVILLLISGCATTKLPAMPVAMLAPKTVTTTASWEEINRVFGRTMVGCSRVLIGFEREAAEAKETAMWFRLVGGAVGSILLPGMVAAGAAGSAIAVAGGISGFANTAPDTIEKAGLGATDYLMAREGVRREMRSVLPKYYEAVELNNKRLAISSINQLHATCVTYALESPAITVEGE